MLAGETLNRRAKYEPNFLRKIRLVVCTKSRVSVIAVVVALIILVIAVLVTVTHKSSGSSSCKPLDKETEENQSSTTAKPDYISTNGKPFPYHDIRLPTSVTPVSYELLLKTSMTQLTFSGTTTVSCSVAQETDFIVMHVKDLLISGVRVKRNKMNTPLTVSEFLIYEENEQLYVKMESPLKKSWDIIVEVDFNGNLTRQLSGFYKSMYKTNTGEER